MTVNDVFLQFFKKELPASIEIRPYNVDVVKNVRELNPQGKYRWKIAHLILFILDIDRLITITGMVTRVSSLIPEMNQGFFECSICKFTIENIVDCGRIDEPVKCSNCNNSYTFNLIHNRSLFIDKQIIKLQEIPGTFYCFEIIYSIFFLPFLGEMPTGATQHTVTLFVHGSLVESVHPGDRVAVTGIFRSNPIRLNPTQRSVKSVFRTSVDVIHFRKLNQERLHEANNGCILY